MKRLAAEKAILKAEAFPGADEKQLNIEINREKCLEYGVPIPEIAKIAQSAGKGAEIEKLKAENVKAANGDSIALEKLAKIESIDAPSGVYRVNLRRAVRITGQPAEGVFVESAASRCAELAKKN